ncbi:MAG: type II toxin-antitoxin system death-on-curing family toxin [Chlamydiales bacterium]
MTTKFLTTDQVMEIHDTFVEEYSGLPGIRDHSLLDSAVQMSKLTVFGEDMHPTLYDKAAAYLYHIVKNHPFNDGNKRTGAGAALIFLRVNGIDPEYDNDSYVQLVVSVAEGSVNKSEIREFFKGILVSVP